MSEVFVFESVDEFLGEFVSLVTGVYGIDVLGFLAPSVSVACGGV